MGRNVGTLDRTLRIVLAIGAIIWALAVGSSSVGGIVLWIIAAILVLTSLSGFCPLYRVFKISTRGD
ncbi:MAG TPA: DUF2892 domain-containing protein [Acidimicrobiales bacterium]|nr:DUF2892 domain-containing protein [Acidimicrobiales bacterium]